jgi:hypothetical protein
MRSQNIAAMLHLSQSEQRRLFDHRTLKGDSMEGFVRAAVVILLFLCTPSYAQGDLTWLHFSVLGFEQAGASSTQADQRFFFDFYATRPLPIGATVTTGVTTTDAYASLQRRTHWWGNVRLASYPQQVNAPIGDFVTGLGTKVSEVKVNEFVQTAEFRTGLDVKVLGSEGSRLSSFAGFGGVGAMDPKQSVSIFKVPDPPVPGQPESLARVQFFERYTKKEFPGLDGAQYVAFSTPDRSRFYRQYGAGLRYTQLRSDNLAPASISASFGQHELISGGEAVGVVGIFEGFFPFKVGNASAYIFGRAIMSLRKNNDAKPVFLEPAIADNKPIQPAAAGVFVISKPSDRDVYSVGIGLDPMQIIRDIINKK